MRACRPCFVLLLALSVACTAAPDPTPDAGDVPGADAGEEGIPQDTLADAFAGAACAFLLRCSPDDFPGGLGACLRAFATRPVQDLSSPVAMEGSVTGGEVTFDAAAAETCFDALRLADCGSFETLDDLPGCATAFVGKQAEDAACRSEWACRAGLRCVLANANACEGACKPWLGAPCAAHSDCEPEGFCRPVSQTAAVCAAFKGDGEDCEQGDRCLAGFTCVGGPGGGKCEPLALEDASCLNTACADGLACTDLRAPPECVILPAAGESCALLRTCATGATCIDDLCRAPGVEGDTCGAGRPACGDGLLCVAGECQRLPNEPDGPCLSNQCGAGFYCDTVASTCQPLPSSGPCFNNRCQPSAWCDAGICRDLSGVGGRCTSAASCQAGLRCGGTGANRTCQVRAASGEACFAITDCADGLDCLSDGGPNRRCGTPVAAGTVCANSGQCGTLARCFQPQPTDADRLCKPIPLGESGTACNAAAPCAADLACLAGFCAPPGAEGSACTAPYYKIECAEGLSCVPDQLGGNKCARLAAVGEPCDLVGQCGHPSGGLVCGDDFKCRVLPGPGEKCAVAEGVQLCDPTRAFCQADASGFTCVAFPAAGARCQSDLQCPPDRSCVLKEGGAFKTCETIVAPACGGD